MFVIVLVSIMSISRIVRTVVDRRALPPSAPAANPGEVEELRATLDNVMARVERLEEERDFFKDLLDAPKAGRELNPPASDRHPSDRTPAP